MATEPPSLEDVAAALKALGIGIGASEFHGLLSGWDLRRVIEFANAAGAIVASRLACSTAMPTSAEVETALAARSPIHAEGTS